MSWVTSVIKNFGKMPAQIKNLNDTNDIVTAPKMFLVGKGRQL